VGFHLQGRVLTDRLVFRDMPGIVLHRNMGRVGPNQYSGAMTMFELLTETAKADRDLLMKNNEAGDDFNKPREVDFAFEAGDREQAQDFAEFVMGKSYGTAHVSEIELGQFSVVVLITMPINQNIINSVSGFMLCLSRLFKIDYQGWGSIIQKS
jgi:hypothetical protein